jgi:CBS domain-containing protein
VNAPKAIKSEVVDMRVQDVMTSDVCSVPPEAGLKEVAQLLSSRAISGVPVVVDGRPVGVVSESDIVAHEQRAESELAQRPRLRLRRRDEAAERTAGEAMSTPPLLVGPHTSAVGAAWLMTEHDVGRLLVVRHGRLVGIVTRSDLVRAFARSDVQIEAEIVEDVLPGLGLSANEVHVEVENGSVVLSGEVDDELDARCLPHAVRSVIGVIEVRSDVRARHPHRAHWPELAELR